MEHSLLHNSFLSIVTLFTLFGFIIYAALNVAHSAEKLAHVLGAAKRNGNFDIFCCFLVEVVVIVMMLLSGAETSIVKDTIFYAIILDVSGIIGLSVYFWREENIRFKISILIAQTIIF